MKPLVHAREEPDQMKKGNDSEWFARSFDVLYPVLYAHRTLVAAAKEAIFAQELLGIKTGDRVFDLCCGAGRHLHYFQDEYASYGLDYSAFLLEQARTTNCPRAQVVRGDMRHIPFDSCFDAVTNFFTSFGYFETEAENQKVLAGVARSLASEGRFFIDYMNAEHVRNTLVPSSSRMAEGYLVEERRWIDEVACRVKKDTVVSLHGQHVNTFHESVRLYAPTEISEMLEAQGLRVEHLFGDYDGAPLSPTLPRLIAVGTKRNR